MNTVKIYAPATIGNVGPGFDVLGLAIKGMGDTIEATKIEGEDIIIDAIHNADSDISTDPASILCPLDPTVYPSSAKVTLVKLEPPSLETEAIMSVFKVMLSMFSFS